MATYIDRAENDGRSNKWKLDDGMSAVNEQGIGLKGSAKVGWGSCVIDTPSTPLQIIWFYDPDGESRNANLEQMRLMLNNVRKMTNLKRTVNTVVVN